MKFMSKLKSEGFMLDLKLEESLHKRYTSRWLETTVGLIKYYEYPEALKEHDTA